MKDVVYSESFREFLQDVTGIELNHTIDMFASRYWNTHHLLCHDDELEGRRIAYIHYFVPDDWNKDDGGALDLFKVNEDGQPSEIMKSFTPSRNTFLFFEISPTSFHQVAEVLAENKERLAISGWFYGKPIERPSPYIESKLPMKSLDDGKRFKLRDWINPMYLVSKTQRQIAEHFEENSSIELKEFLNEEKSKLIHDALIGKEVPWKVIGPYNRRHYETLGRWNVHEDVTGILKDANDFFLSPQVGELIRKLTSLEIEEGHCEIRKFKSTHYTLSQDNHDQIQERGLDAYYFVCPRDEWDIDVGGQITYMDEEDELITMVPEQNSFSLAYRDAGCMKFVKYVNSQAPGDLYMYTMTYLEDPESIQNEPNQNESNQNDIDTENKE